jgi:hypothetical protein
MLRRAQSNDPEFTLDELPPPIRKVVARSIRASDLAPD